MSTLFDAAAFMAADGETVPNLQSLIGPIINLGAVGCCLVLLAMYYIKKDKKYESRIDERIAAEANFRKDQAEQQDKYRVALEKFGQTLDSVLRVMQKRGND